MHGDLVFVSATPGDYELERGGEPVQQVIRPTGLLDPMIEIRPLEGQVDDVFDEIRSAAKRGERVLVTTLTKKNSERLSDYLRDLGVKSSYLHSELDALERVRVLSKLRAGDFDCLIGINLLREGIDLPEVALVDIEPDVNNRIHFTLLPSSESGRTPELAESTNESLWINYTSALPGYQNSRSITAEISQGTIPRGISLYLEARSY